MRPAPEAPKIVEARMDADADTLLFRQHAEPVHGVGIAGVKAASHARRFDDLHQRRIVADVIGAPPFRDVGVEVDHLGHWRALPWDRAALTPSRHGATPDRSGIIIRTSIQCEAKQGKRPPRKEVALCRCPGLSRLTVHRSLAGPSWSLPAWWLYVRHELRSSERWRCLITRRSEGREQAGARNGEQSEESHRPARCQQPPAALPAGCLGPEAGESRTASGSSATRSPRSSNWNTNSAWRASRCANRSSCCRARAC